MTANYLSTAEIAGMRADVLNRILDQTCTIQRNTPGAADTHGKAVASWGALHTAIRCHYWEAQESELVGTPNATRTRERLVLPANTDVTTADRVTSVIGVDAAQVAGALNIREVLKREFDVLCIVEAVK